MESAKLVFKGEKYFFNARTLKVYHSFIYSKRTMNVLQQKINKFMRRTWATTWSLLSKWCFPNNCVDRHLSFSDFFDHHLHFFKCNCKSSIGPMRGGERESLEKQKEVLAESCCGYLLESTDQSHPWEVSMALLWGNEALKSLGLTGSEEGWEREI